MKIRYHFYFLWLVFSIVVNIAHSQNLVPNSGFENIKNCPNSWVDIVQKPVALNWYSPDAGTPDYYNVCGTNAAKAPNLWSGYQMPSEGKGLAGIYNWSKSNYKEYIAVKLKESLKKDSAYTISFGFSNAKYSEYACFDIGLLLSKDSIISDGYISVIDSRLDSNKWNPVTQWARFEKTYIANGEEEFLFIGNVLSSVNPDTIKFINKFVHPMIKGRSYMYIDEVVIEQLYKPIYPTGESFVIENIYFEFDKSILKQGSYLELDRLVNYLEKHEDFSITIIGHTDEVGTEEYNNKLSLKRADVVKSYLVVRKIEESRVTTLGQGEYENVEFGDSEQLRSKNRRVEFILSVDKF